MNYYILGMKHQMHILGNFLYINENRKTLNKYPYFNILFDIEDIPLDSKIVSLFPCENIKHVTSIKEIFDVFELPYFYASKQEIERFY